ncbi:GH1 family beta-glucosidase [Paractinoplanes globisporus]|uniref:Beta-glucosidase n=1 Tax=Paractinoplanes globisporus TaxID=113565 RepID=A0ABW6W534_9ACTN|nr:GH1 family beta-glucosidase [Actinoplanes globisporus]
MGALSGFPEGFQVGVSTASYQIEGAVHEGGRGPSIWDTFAHTPGRILNGDTGDVACDHYHRWEEDLDLLAGLGVDAYRFSVAWPRVQPDGTGRPNPDGLDFYDRLVDGLVARGIAAVPTLFHWDLPQALEDQGGWLSRETALRFGTYAGHVADRLGDRVQRWITLNEPIVHMAQGYAFGTHAPGRELLLDALPVAHHQLLGHGLAVRELRSRGAAEVMITNNCTPVVPASEKDEDQVAAMIYDGFHNRLFNDPVLKGTYPEFLAAGLEPVIQPDDMAIIRTSLDALGINYYNPTRVAAAEGDLPFEMVPIEGVPTTAFGWPVVPEGLHDLLTGLKTTYGDDLPPIYITENGCSTAEDLDDRFRIDYLDRHLAAVRRAIVDGTDVRGYFVWSLMDNFEWAEGYSQRFGLVHINFNSLARTPRASYRWLQAALKERG